MNYYSATFLIVEEGKEFTVHAESAEEMIELIRSNLNGKTVMTEISEEEYDDPFEIVMDVTDGDPLADLTLEDAAHLIGEAEARGYSVPDDLTPEEFLAIYEDMKNTEEE